MATWTCAEIPYWCIHHSRQPNILMQREHTSWFGANISTHSQMCKVIEQ